jgi:hypothetical protein
MSDNPLIADLMTMYHDNITQIDNLMRANNQIRSLLLRLAERQLNPNASQPQAQNINSRRQRNINPLLPVFSTFFDPVLVYPSEQQIENATESIHFQENGNFLNTSCPITLEQFRDNMPVTRIKHCGHIFSPDALRVWFRSSCICPICRYDIRNYSTTTTNGNEQQSNRNLSSVVTADEVVDALTRIAASSFTNYFQP